MKKLNLRRIIIPCILYIFPIETYAFNSPDNSIIEISDNRFTSANIDKDNQSEIYFDSMGNDGYGLLFLGGESIDRPNTSLVLQSGSNSDTITCEKQLRGYYSTNYGNFSLFPIDSETLGEMPEGNIDFTGGLFYDCKNGNTTYNGVYGYIKWTVGDLGNTQEIRAGVDKNTANWKTSSPLKIIINGLSSTNRALSGNALDSLAQDSRIIASFSLLEKIQIRIPEDYFSPNTKIFSGNRNEITFNDAGNNGYGLFFLGTGIEGNYHIATPDNNDLFCRTQLNGYYTISFTDFGVFPLDQNTLDLTSQLPGTIDVSVTGGLYTNCDHNDKNGVYGHIKWTYGINGSNTHEIRAGITNTDNGTRLNNSPLEIIYSENFRNINRSLSGNFHSSLIKNSVVKNRFFGDMGLQDNNGQNIIPQGTLDNHYFYIPYDDFSHDNIRIYTKSSTTGSNVIIKLTGYDINGNIEITNRTTNNSLSNQISNYGFYGLYTTDFPSNNHHNMRSGTINVVMTNSGETRSKTIDFLIQPAKPEINIYQDTDCSTGITISATASENATLSYIITGSSECNQNMSSSIPFTNYQGPLTLTDDNYNNMYVCFKAVAYDEIQTNYRNRQITGIDNLGPVVTFNNAEIPECNTEYTRSVSATDICAGIQNSNGYLFSTTSFGNGEWGNSNSITLNSDQIGRTGGISKPQTVTVKDNFGNETEKTATGNIKDIPPTLHGEPEYVIQINTISGDYNFGNIFDEFNATEGNCGMTDLTGQLISCTKATQSTLTDVDNNLLIRPDPDTNATNGTCTVVFIDNENSVATGYVRYIIDTKPPVITFSSVPSAWNACYRSKKIKINLNEIGTIYYYTGTNPICEESGPYVLGKEDTQTFSLTFRQESDNGTYICAKAFDSAGNVSYSGSSMITGIDLTAPTFELSGKDIEPTQNGYKMEIYECESGYVEIVNVQQIGCAPANTNPYSRNGGSTYTAMANHTTGSNKVRNATISVRVKDNLNNGSSKSLRFNRIDRPIFFEDQPGDQPEDKTKTIFIDDMIEEIMVYDLVNKFQLTGRGNCEKIVVTPLTCNNASMVLNGDHIVGSYPNYDLKITPNDNIDSTGWCEISFKDCNSDSNNNCNNPSNYDNILTGHIEFRVKTKNYLVVLDSGHEFSKGQIKDDTTFDIGKIHLDVTNSGGGQFDITNKYTIESIERGQHDNTSYWLDDTTIGINSKINYTLNDLKLCLSGNIKVNLDEGFITDPAGNPSEATGITTNQTYELRPHICVSGDNVINNNTFEYTQGQIKSGFDIHIFTTNGGGLTLGTGDILCTGMQNCPGFSCSDSGIIQKIPENHNIMCNNGGNNVYGFINHYILHIDPNPSAGQPYPEWHEHSGETRIEWTGCIIKMKDTACPELAYTTINLKSITTPYKFGQVGSEDFYAGKIGEAISEGSGDNGFFFYMSNPQFVERERGGKGVVGNIYYEMDFNTGVADEFYHIEGTGIVNGYQETLKIKRPTYNYSNPRSYLFNFPYYTSPDETY